jgi:teichuronic acid biosynthesis glycosyltransferase TuaC
LRVLSISTLFPSAARQGFGLFVARQAEALAKRGDVEVVIIHPIANAPQPFDRLINSPAERNLPAQTHDWGVEVHYPRYTWLPRIGPRWNPGLIARAVLPLARRLHAERPFDLVDAQFFYPDGPAAARIAETLELPLSIKARGSDIHLWGGKGFARKAMLAAAGQAAGLLSVSAALKADMAALGMADSKIAVHYTGLDHARFHPLPRAETRAALVANAGLAIPADVPLLIAVGNLIALKGHDLAIAALAHVPRAHLAIAGGGPLREALIRQATDLGLVDRVHLLGSLKPDAMARWLSAADVFVLPSEREGLANAWIEALACGTPLVISDVGGAREVVADTSAGRLAARDAQSIAAAVRDVLSEGRSQAEVAANAERFSWDENAAQLAVHYQRIAATPNSLSPFDKLRASG